MRVGLLEDDMAIQEMLELVLQDEGYAVSIFFDAQACLTALGAGKTSSAAPIDLMIVDWRLDEYTTGIEVIQQLRSYPHLLHLPIILTTAATFTDTEALQHLQVSLLEKPFSVDDMLELISQMLTTSP